MMNSIKSNRMVIYILTFLFALHTTPAGYINSSFLAQFVGEKFVGYIFSAGAVVTIVAFIFIRKILRKYGNYKTFLAALGIELVTLLVLVLVDIPAVAVTAYIIGFTMRSLSGFHLDIFLEHFSTDGETGSVRGAYLTAVNIAILIGPLTASFILTNGDYWKIYLLSSLLLLPVFFMMIRYMSDFKDPHYHKTDIIGTAKKIYGHCNLYGTFVCNFLLRFFYSWMVIYTPIYLNQTIGFSLSKTMIILGIGLIPFIILQKWFGKLADTVLGEKELLTAGFIIMAFSTATLSFLTEPNLYLWGAVLFTTRIGASMVEVMSEVYLFKKIDSKNINIISFFRLLRPVSYIVAPVTASILLFFVDFKYIFLILGVIMLYGVRYSLAIKDTL